eukprot:403338297
MSKSRVIRNLENKRERHLRFRVIHRLRQRTIPRQMGSQVCHLGQIMKNNQKKISILLILFKYKISSYNFKNLLLNPIQSVSPRLKTLKQFPDPYGLSQNENNSQYDIPNQMASPTQNSQTISNNQTRNKSHQATSRRSGNGQQQLLFNFKRKTIGMFQESISDLRSPGDQWRQERLQMYQSNPLFQQLLKRKEDLENKKTQSKKKQKLLQAKNFEEGLDKDSQMIVLSYNKNELKNYILSLPSIIATIKSKTSQLFIPTVIQNSPINPQHEMLLTMRSIEKMDKYQIDPEVIIDDTKLAKSFFIRDIQFLTSDPNERKNQLQNDLIQMYQLEGLMIIGGVQEAGAKQNNLKLLFYKTEHYKAPSRTNHENNHYEIQVEQYSAETTSQKDFEMIINEAQVQNNSQLRTVISFEDSNARYHFVVFQVYQADRIYMINDYPKYLCDEYKKITQEALLKPNDPHVKQQFAEKMSQFMNVQEKRSSNIIVECITNDNLGDSFIVYSQ